MCVKLINAISWAYNFILPFVTIHVSRWLLQYNYILTTKDTFNLPFYFHRSLVFQESYQTVGEKRFTQLTGQGNKHNTQFLRAKGKERSLTTRTQWGWSQYCQCKKPKQALPCLPPPLGHVQHTHRVEWEHTKNSSQGDEKADLPLDFLSQARSHSAETCFLLDCLSHPYKSTGIAWVVCGTDADWVSNSHCQDGEIKARQVQRQRQDSPEEVKVLEGFSWVRGLKLAGVEHEQTHKVQPSHAGRVARLVADCTWEQKGPSDPRNPGPMEIKCISQEAWLLWCSPHFPVRPHQWLHFPLYRQ